jgi:hypothetical protein
MQFFIIKMRNGCEDCRFVPSVTELLYDAQYPDSVASDDTMLGEK